MNGYQKKNLKAANKIKSRKMISGFIQVRDEMLEDFSVKNPFWPLPNFNEWARTEPVKGKYKLQGPKEGTDDEGSYNAF